MGPPTDNIHQRLALLILIVDLNLFAMMFTLGSDMERCRFANDTDPLSRSLASHPAKNYRDQPPDIAPVIAMAINLTGITTTMFFNKSTNAT
jgi:hypothetical protein